MITTQSTPVFVSLIRLICRACRQVSVFVCATCVFGMAYAHSYATTKTMQGTYKVNVSQYELALAQVLFEICPPMLSKEQQNRFFEAYQNQLRVFIPTVSDPNETLRHLANQRNYQTILQNIRTWTASFPPQENQQLCQEFARKTATF